jgi:GNAT superfamily N-acetyltransferase
MADLMSGALDVSWAWLTLGNEVLDLEGGRFVRNRDLPAKRDANHVTRITSSTPGEIDRLLTRADEVFAGIPHRAFYLDYRTPPAFEARLQLEGYQRSEGLVHVLEGELRGAPTPYEIRPVSSQADWDAYEALHEIDWLEDNEGREPLTERWNPAVSFRAVRNVSPPARPWLAWLDGRAVAYFSSWEGVAGVGQVEDLFTHPDYRHRGLATALIHHCVADARSHGAGPVVIASDPTDTPKHMYAAMGFVPVAIQRSYWRRASGEG